MYKQSYVYVYIYLQKILEVKTETDLKKEKVNIVF